MTQYSWAGIPLLENFVCKLDKTETFGAIDSFQIYEQMIELI